MAYFNDYKFPRWHILMFANFLDGIFQCSHISKMAYFNDFKFPRWHISMITNFQDSIF
ncbi:hypothetical protein LOTGIDRAFT_148845 [Lottia gigantea]|uniref:Uncharacterized protein n=1 Tax=Lottia gigantea TaxID=225164 RepID=V4AW88_LOTGI|nr:hypothetical protein LOTGIDRAFT_148845 [Lottia gigantea]ESP01738.1 hypothetical protein LOTGIDRAFT_148845 [Lottia gigantea]